jgi:hypothetical protein
MVLRIPGIVEARLLGGDGLLDRVRDDLLRGLVIAALLGQNEYAEFHVPSPENWAPGFARSGMPKF